MSSDHSDSESRSPSPAPRTTSKNWLKRKKVAQAPGRNAKVHGHIPGYPVGSTFADRQECSAAGVHAPLRGGIHGNSTHGAYSVVLSGGYEDDEDKGETFVYSGQGGRDTSGDQMDKMQGKIKWEGPQNADQEWIRGNKALKISATTKKPVRVIRSALRKKNQFSRYAPSEGLRYDGLYVVDRAWRETGSTGFQICKFAFRRLPHQPPLPGERLRTGAHRTRSVSPVAGPSKIVPKVVTQNPASVGRPRPASLPKPYRPPRRSPTPIAGPSKSRPIPELPAFHLQKSGGSLKRSSVQTRPTPGPSKARPTLSSNHRDSASTSAKSTPELPAILLQKSGVNPKSTLPSRPVAGPSKVQRTSLSLRSPTMSRNAVAGSSRTAYPQATPQPLKMVMIRPEDRMISSGPSSANSSGGVKRPWDETDDDDDAASRDRRSVMSGTSAESGPATAAGRWDSVRGISKLSNLKFKKIKKPEDSEAT